VISLVLYLVGINKAGEVLTGWVIGALEEPIVLVAVGIALIALAALGSLRVYQRRRQPEVTPQAVVLWVVFDLILISLGVVALVAAFSSGAGTRGF
jgi:hypothetical protein